MNSSCTVRARQTLQNFRTETDPTQKQTLTRQAMASLSNYMTETDGEHKQRLSLSKWPQAARGGAAVLHQTDAQSWSCLFFGLLVILLTLCDMYLAQNYTAAEMQNITIASWFRLTLSEYVIAMPIKQICNKTTTLLSRQLMSILCQRRITHYPIKPQLPYWFPST